ncbi:MAG TPA: DUF4398 domain-containing protein [bacterium]|nr:DUF4398 domain-containing protein [bacterium]HQI49469.1 DUF4398 domain-containing protein [bacterium]
MKVKALVTVLVVVFAMALMLGCAKVPQQELDAAKAALDAAKAAEADRYVPELFNAAKDSLTAATAEIEKQNSKFALFRSFKRAKDLIAKVTTGANDAVAQAAVKKEEVKKEAEGILAQITPAIENVKKLMKKAPRGKEGRAALEAINSDLAAVEASVAEVNTAMTNGDFLTARDKAQANLQKLNSLAEELQAAINKKLGK